MAALWLLLLACPLACAGAPSRRVLGGSAFTLSISGEPFSYSLSLNGSSWLSGGGAVAHCNNVGRSSFNGTLLASGALFECGGVDARLGAYDCIALALAPSDGDADCGVTVAFHYYHSSDAFEFLATFAAHGVAGTAKAPQPNVAGWPQGPWPLATAFPVFSATASRLGFTETRGNMLSANFVWSRTLDAYAGGLEGGPLLLFDAAGGGVHPPALVLSPRTHAKSVFVAPWGASVPVSAPPMSAPPMSAPPTSASPVHAPPAHAPPAHAPLAHPPPATSVAGVFREVDHGRMDPLVCITSLAGDGATATATFLNGDPRAARGGGG